MSTQIKQNTIDLIALKNAIDALPVADEKDSTDLIEQGPVVTVPAGYYPEDATAIIAEGSVVAPVSGATATISIGVDSTGKVTASASGITKNNPVVTEGYITSNDVSLGNITISGSNTYQLSTQAAKTVTPSTSEQTAVASGKYTTGAVKVAAMPTGALNNPTASVSNGQLVAKTTVKTSGYLAAGTEVSANVAAVRTSADLTASGATVTVPAGLFTENATKSISTGYVRVPTKTVGVTPTITISEAGVVSVSGSQQITIAPETVIDGYITQSEADKGAGTLTISASNSLVLPTEKEQTITPSKTSKVAVKKGFYTVGDITIAPIPADYIITNAATATSADIMNNKTAFAKGQMLVGTFTLDTELERQASLLNQIREALQGKARPASEDELVAAAIEQQSAIITELENTINSKLS